MTKVNKKNTKAPKTISTTAAKHEHKIWLGVGVIGLLFAYETQQDFIVMLFAAITGVAVNNISRLSKE